MTAWGVACEGHEGGVPLTANVCGFNHNYAAVNAGDLAIGGGALCPRNGSSCAVACQSLARGRNCCSRPRLECKVHERDTYNRFSSL